MVALITGARARLPCSQPWLSSCVTGMDHWSLLTSPSFSSPLLSFLLPSYLLAPFLPFSFPAPHPRPISVLTSAYSVVQICLKIGAILCASLPIVCIRGICLHAQGTYFLKLRLLHMCNGIKATFFTAVLGWICENNGPMRVNAHPLWALHGDQVILELNESLHLLQTAQPGYLHWCQVCENNRLFLLFSPHFCLFPFSPSLFPSLCGWSSVGAIGEGFPEFLGPHHKQASAR